MTTLSLHLRDLVRTSLSFLKEHYKTPKDHIQHGAIFELDLTDKTKNNVNTVRRPYFWINFKGSNYDLVIVITFSPLPWQLTLFLLYVFVWNLRGVSTGWNLQLVLIHLSLESQWKGTQEAGSGRGYLRVKGWDTCLQSSFFSEELLLSNFLENFFPLYLFLYNWVIILSAPFDDKPWAKALSHLNNGIPRSYCGQHSFRRHWWVQGGVQ